MPYIPNRARAKIDDPCFLINGESIARHSTKGKPMAAKIFAFRVILEGRALRPTKKVVCRERVPHAMPTRREMEHRTDDLHRWNQQPAEYTAYSRDGAIAQFEAEFPKYTVITE